MCMFYVYRGDVLRVVTVHATCASVFCATCCMEVWVTLCM